MYDMLVLFHFQDNESIKSKICRCLFYGLDRKEIIQEALTKLTDTESQEAVMEGFPLLAKEDPSTSVL